MVVVGGTEPTGVVVVEGGWGSGVRSVVDVGERLDVAGRVVEVVGAGCRRTAWAFGATTAGAAASRAGWGAGAATEIERTVVFVAPAATSATTTRS